MAPFLTTVTNTIRSVDISSPDTTAEYFAAQWVNPGDIFSVLLLLGPEIVQQAVAQLAGRSITPVAFSFGWVAYSTKALKLALTEIDGRLMPDTDMANTMVIAAGTGHVRTTSNWILGRLLRDMDDRDDSSAKNEQPHVPPSRDDLPTAETEKRLNHSMPWQALRISVFEVVEEPDCLHGVPHRDWLWFSGFIVITIQLVIAMLPWVFHGEWGTFLITAYGNFLALVGASLPQWKREKWSCPKQGGATVTITQGNGSRHAVVILGKKGVGLDLEILAQGTRTAPPSRSTRFAAGVLLVQWLGLLITAAGLKIDTWYLLGVGALGSLQNLIAAGAPRQPRALGVHIKDTGRPISGTRVAHVLKMAEEQYPGVGISLVPIFFPGSMRIREQDFAFWRDAQERIMAPNQHGTRLDNLPPL
ncbi:hypothetical protein N7519_007745 [Penicillium mononematosum]|uniref:uncharacterized protein n=1 Tax=Penicillium mononematosum TaxID=268346 RepID=UPI0025493D3F|nr:uncharacterized protein N7519_007745 [Penicillium mononematosum]KAJ6186444.1 hypothetical protein N7519_007745 [Penicillium mononematosum]